MRLRKYVTIPVEALDDPNLSSTEIYLLAQILRFQSIFDLYTVSNLNQKLNLSKNTIRKGLLLLTESGYLTRISDNGGWKLNEVKICAPEDQNLSSERSKSDPEEVKICVSNSSESEEKRTKREEKETHDIEDGSRDKKENIKEDKENIRNTLSVSSNDSINHNINAFVEQEDGKKARRSREYQEIIGYLNEKTGKRFTSKSRDTQGHISARLDEGFTVADFKTVIDKKVREWMGTEMEKYLRPETLFSKKFDRYLNETNIIRRTESGWDYRVDMPGDPMLDEIWSAGSGGRSGGNG